MALGHDGTVFALAFDDPGALGVALGGDVAPDAGVIRDAARLVCDGLVAAAERSPVPASHLVAVVDGSAGDELTGSLRDHGLRVALAVERHDQPVLDLAHGDDLGAHVEAVAPDLVKVLLRWNPGHDPDRKKTQARRLASLAAWLHETDRTLLVALLVPPTDADLDRVGGDHGRHRRELRPDLTVRAVQEIRDLGVEPDVWAVEGLDDRGHVEDLGRLVTDAGREDVLALVLEGDDPDHGALDHRLRQAAPVDGFGGFVLGASVWAAPARAALADGAERDGAVTAIADAVARAIDTYTAARSA